MTYVWRRAELMMRVQMNQLAEGRAPVAKCGHNRDVWEGRLKEFLILLTRNVSIDGELSPHVLLSTPDIPIDAEY